MGGGLSASEKGTPSFRGEEAWLDEAKLP